MLSLLKKRLGFRIIFYMAVMVTVFGLFMGYYVYRNAAQRSWSEKNLYLIHGKTIIRNVVSGVTLIFALQNKDAGALAQEAKSLFSDPSVSYVAYYDDQSKLVYQTFRPGLAEQQFDFPTPDWNNAGDNEVTQEFRSKAGESFMDFSMKVRMVQDMTGASVGWLRVGMSLAELNNQIRRSRIEGGALIAVVLIMGLSVVIFSLRQIMPPVNRLAQAARDIGQGNFNVDLEVKSEDEIGLLTKTFNEMAANLKKETQRSKGLVENISDAVMLLSEVTNKLMTITHEQAAGASQQASIVQEVVSTTGEIAATAKNIAGAATSVNEAAEKASEVCNKGKEYIESSISGMNRIQEQVKRVTENIVDLSAQTKEIGGIVHIIEEISGQTNLLALNAALEAVGAGESGKRFSVVAAEVRRLASRTLGFTETIKQTIESIQKSTGAMVMISEEQEKSADDGAKSVMQMGEYFGHILEMVGTTHKAASEINLITKQQATASEQMVSSIQGVETVALQVGDGVHQIENLMAELKTLADHLQEQTQEAI